MEKILLLIQNKQGRQFLETNLPKGYQILSDQAEKPLQQDFDLAIVDGPALKRCRRDILARRKTEEPAFLPFLLLTVRRKGGIPVRHLGKLADDVIVKPIHRDELRARVANLLHRRALSLEFKREHDRVLRLTVTDDVTGFRNTRYLRRYLDRFFDAPITPGKKLSLIFFDVDNFKEVVDTWGHLLGSRILREVAQATASCLDSDDRVVRYGGDEFVVILPDQDKSQAQRKVELIRNAISRTPLLHKEGRDVHVTASFGVATTPDDASSEEALLAAADECLFISKRGGKNRITVAQTEADQ